MPAAVYPGRMAVGCGVAKGEKNVPGDTGRAMDGEEGEVGDAAFGADAVAAGEVAPVVEAPAGEAAV